MVLLSAAALHACSDAGSETSVDPATIGEQRALEDARQMIEQHAEPAGADGEAAAEREDVGE